MAQTPRNVTITLPDEVWDTICNCIPSNDLLNVETLQNCIRFVSAYKTEINKRVMKPVWEEEDQDS